MLEIKPYGCSVNTTFDKGTSIDLAFEVFPKNLTADLIKVQELYTLGKYRELFIYLGRNIE